MLELLFWFDSCVNALVRRIYWAWNNSLQWVQSILKVWNIRHSHYLTSDCQFHEARRWETDRMAPIFLFKTERTFPSLKEIWLTFVQTLFGRFCMCYLGAIHHFVQLNKLYILDTLLVADIACYWQNKTCGFVLPRSGKHSHGKSCHFGTVWDVCCFSLQRAGQSSASARFMASTWQVLPHSSVFVNSCQLLALLYLQSQIHT